MPKRIEYIDKLKGFAILFVVMGHVADFGLGIKHTIFNEFYISFHMPLFMFISGIFAFKTHSKPSLQYCQSLLVKRAKRLLQPFVVVGALYSALSVGTLYGHLLGNPGRLWFLPTLFMLVLWGLIWLCLSNVNIKSIGNQLITPPPSCIS